MGDEGMTGFVGDRIGQVVLNAILRKLLNFPDQRNRRIEKTNLLFSEKFGFGFGFRRLFLRRSPFLWRWLLGLGADRTGRRKYNQ